MNSEMEAHAGDSTAYTGRRSLDSGGGYETYALICRVHGARLQNYFRSLEEQNNSGTKRVGRQQLSH